MTRTDLIECIAKDVKISKATAQAALDSFLTYITYTLRKGGKITMVGFGTFSTVRRNARKVRNPNTGEIFKIKAANIIKFRAGRALRDAIN
jgi:DNA-binding protein HU-beta